MLTSTKKTIYDLLASIRDGQEVSLPVLIAQPAQHQETVEATIISNVGGHLASGYSRDYDKEEFTILETSRLRNGKPIPVSIGRSRRCDVLVDNHSVSKKHASIFSELPGEKHFLVDEGSKNGTRINGVPLKAGVSTPLRSGAYVTFGEAVLVFIDAPMLRRMAVGVAS